MLDRAARGTVTLHDDRELQARVRSLRPESAALILESDVAFSLTAVGVPLSGSPCNGNIARVQARSGHIECVLGDEVRQKLLRKKAAGVDESTLQRLVTVWMVFAQCAAELASSTFYLDFSDLAQYPGPCVAFCSNRADDCLVPDPFFLMDYGYLSQKRKLSGLPAWQERQQTLFWRGSSSGLGTFGETDRYYYLTRLAEHSPPLPLNAGFSRITPKAAATMTAADEKSLRSRGLLKDPVPKATFADYRYLLDIDGNSNSWGGLYSNLLTGSVVVKCESRNGFRQWYYDRLVSNDNCFLLDASLENLPELSQLMTNDALAAGIGARGREFARSLVIDEEIEYTRSALRDWLARS